MRPGGSFAEPMVRPHSPEARQADTLILTDQGATRKVTGASGDGREVRDGIRPNLASVQTCVGD
jgi:hypothetical protein